MLDQLTVSDLLAPSGGYARLRDEQGMSPEAAFDAIAQRAAGPELRGVIAKYQMTPQGRELLTMLAGWWDRAGLPCPWDNVLELPHGSNESEG